MNELHIAENIVRIRKEKGVTQEEMADFLGVTKASVSKWETGKSMPDIVLLPTLAAYLGMTVDELLGYEPQLDNEEILEIYKKLMYEFTEEPFETVYKKSWTLVKKYYTCYPFLFQMTVLWLNHFYMADSEKRRIEVLNDILKLFRHIKKNCR